MSTIISNKITKLIENRSVSNESDKFKLIEHMTSSPPTYSTVLKWMNKMGIKQEMAKKCYYVDGNEKPEQQIHSTKFVSEYLTKIEPTFYR